MEWANWAKSRKIIQPRRCRHKYKKYYTEGNFDFYWCERCGDILVKRRDEDEKKKRK